MPTPSRPDNRTVFALACVLVAALLACKKSRPAGPSAPTASASAIASAAPTISASVQQTPRPVIPEPKIDATRADDRDLCVRPAKTPDALTNEPAEQIVSAMRGALRSVRTNEVYGAVIMEFPSIESWIFKVRASRESGLVYEARLAKKETEKIEIVQLPLGATYARGKFFFSLEPELGEKVKDQWVEVPAELLKVSPSDAQPSGPQGVFGMDVGHKAVIAAFAQEAISWYPDQQADWLLGASRRDKKSCVSSVGCPGSSPPSKSMSTIDKSHRFFAGCQSVLITSGGVDLQLSASRRPLPLQYEPRPGTITGRFRWGHYNRRLPPQTAPVGALSLASL